MTEPDRSSAVSSEVEEIKANLGKIPFAEKILAPIAILVILGWLLQWSIFWKIFFSQLYPTLSFLGALGVAVLVILKLFGKRPLPPRIEKYAIAISSLLPVVGFVLGSFSSVEHFLTAGGAIALGYISATTYWRRQISELTPKQLGEGAAAQPAEKAEGEKPS